MIWDSDVWKRDLLQRAAELRRLKTRRRWTDTGHAKLEQLVMIGFYSVRKLHEATKLSSATVSQPISLRVYPWTGERVTKLNWHHVDRAYDLDAPRIEHRDALFLCHQIVHSFVFMALFGENNRLHGILFASDRQRHLALLGVSIDQVAELFDAVGRDYPHSATYLMNEKTCDYDVVSS